MNSTITIVGNVTRDPELRFTGSGLATASFGVAVNRKLPPRADGGSAEAVTFFNVVAWQSLAENAAESLHKGNRVIVSGRLEQRSWENAEGERRTIFELVADEIGPSLRWVTATLTRIEKILPGGTPTAPADLERADTSASGGYTNVQRSDEPDEPAFAAQGANGPSTEPF